MMDEFVNNLYGEIEELVWIFYKIFAIFDVMWDCPIV